MSEFGEVGFCKSGSILDLLTDMDKKQKVLLQRVVEHSPYLLYEGEQLELNKIPVCLFLGKLRTMEYFLSKFWRKKPC